MAGCRCLGSTCCGGLRRSICFRVPQGGMLGMLGLLLWLRVRVGFDRRGGRRFNTPLLHLYFVFPLTLEILACFSEVCQTLAETLTELRQFTRAKDDQGDHQN